MTIPAPEEVVKDWQRLHIALVEILSMEGEEGLTDATFVSEALRIAAEAINRPKSAAALLSREPQSPGTELTNTGEKR